MKDKNKASDELMANITGGTDDDNTLTDFDKVFIKATAIIMKGTGDTLEEALEYFTQRYPDQAVVLAEYIREIWPTL